MSRKHLLAVAAVAALGLAAGGAHAAAFQNGSFELGTFTPDGSGAMDVQNGTMPGWNLAGQGDVSWDVDGAFGLNKDSAAGTHFLDLTGYNDAKNGGFGGVSQTFTTVANGHYTVTFDLGGNLDYASNGSGVLVSAGGSSKTLVNDDKDSDGHNIDYTVWRPETFTFTATSASTSLSFVGTQGQAFIGLDNVAVTETAGQTGGVPEPASWALMILGFGGAGAALRSRRKGLLAAA